MKELSGSSSSKEELLEDKSPKEVLSQETLPKEVLSQETLPEDFSFEYGSVEETLPQDLSPADNAVGERLSEDLPSKDDSAKERLSEDLSSEDDDDDYETPHIGRDIAKSLRAAMQWCDEVANTPNDIFTNFKSQLPFLIVLGGIIILLWILRIIYG